MGCQKLPAVSIINATYAPQNASNAILTGLQDEYLAEATYAASIDKFGNIRPFSNIINAERTHQNALKNLLTTYGVNIPDNPYVSGAKKTTNLPSSKSEETLLSSNIYQHFNVVQANKPWLN